MTRRSSAVRVAALSSLAFAGMFLTGCSDGGRTVSYRANPTPELKSQAQTQDEIDNRLTITNDTNLRMLSTDLGKMFLLDRPSRLSSNRVAW